MLCSYRYHVRPQRSGTPPSRPLLTVGGEAPSPSPQPPQSQPPAVIDTPPHVALVRQYAW